MLGKNFKRSTNQIAAKAVAIYSKDHIQKLYPELPAATVKEYATLLAGVLGGDMPVVVVWPENDLAGFLLELTEEQYVRAGRLMPEQVRGYPVYWHETPTIERLGEA